MITVLYECFCSLTSVYVYSVCFIIAVNTLVLFVSIKCSSVVWELELELLVTVVLCIKADCQEHSVHASYPVNGSVLWRNARNCLALHSCYYTGFDSI